MAPLPLGVAAHISSAFLHARASPFSPPEPRAAAASSPPPPNLRQRQSTDDFVTDTYGAVDSSPSPGAVVGIVLGSIAGFLLLLWTIHICIHIGKPPVIFEGTIASQSGSSVVTAHRRRHSTKSHSSRAHSRRRHSRRKSGGSSGGGRRRETVEIRTSSHMRPVIVDEPRGPLRPPSSGPQVTKVVDGRRRSTSRPIAIPVAPSETTTETTATEDIIVVRPPPPVRHHSRRNSGQSYHYRRRSSGH